MVFKLLSSSLRSVLVLPVRLGAGCLRRAASGFYVPGSAVVSFSTVNWKFQPKTKPLGFGVFPAARKFPGAGAGRGFMPFAYTAAFPTNLSNTTLNTGRHETAVVSSTFGAWRRLASRWALLKIVYLRYGFGLKNRCFLVI